MLTVGLDIGSRTIALIECFDGSIVREEIINTSANPVENARLLLDGHDYDHVVATGYGRHLAVENKLAGSVITEIKAYAVGAQHLYSDVQTVLDIGGQDTKIIAYKADGNVSRFEMNDRCAAGTGRFLENMASVLSLSVEKLGGHALSAKGKSVQLSSMCTVFAESEVISAIGRGENSYCVALGIHQAIAKRVGVMIRRVGLQERFVFAGGVALNPCMRHLLEQELGVSVSVPANPQIVGALGAALWATELIT